MLEIPALLALALGALFLCIVKVPPYTGIIISFLGKPVRSRGHGVHLRIPLLEQVGDFVSTRKRNVKFKLNAEAHNRDVIPLNISAEYYPNPKLLLRFFSFTKEQIEEAVIERLKSLLSIEVHKKDYKNRDGVYDNLRAVANSAQNAFKTETIVSSGKKRTLEDYYGVQLPAVMIADPELPAALAEAELEKERMQELNKARGLEWNKMLAMAEQVVKRVEKRRKEEGRPPLPAEERERVLKSALHEVQLKFNPDVKEHHQVISLNKETLAALTNGIALALAGRKGGDE